MHIKRMFDEDVVERKERSTRYGKKKARVRFV